MKAEHTIEYKQSQMLQSAMNRERAMRQQIAALQHDIEWYRVALANALEERGNRMVMHPVHGSIDFHLEYNISNEPILILEVTT